MKHHMNTKDELETIAANGGKPIEVHCDVCGERHYQGIGCYPLRKVRGYEMFCCKACIEGNWDGWKPSHEARILALLDEKGIAHPPRNADGLLPAQF